MEGIQIIWDNVNRRLPVVIRAADNAGNNAGHAAPNQAAPNQAAPNQAAPNQAALNRAAPNQAAPNANANPEVVAPQPAPLPPPTRTYVAPFPIVTNCEFNMANPEAQLDCGQWGGLTWDIVYKSFNTNGNYASGTSAVVFRGMGKKTYRVHFKYDLTQTSAKEMWMRDQNVMIDDEHPYFLCNNTIDSTTRRDDLPKTVAFNLSIEFIEPVEKFEYDYQKWPPGQYWFQYRNDYSVRCDSSALERIHPKYSGFLRNFGRLSKKEAFAFYEFLGVMTHNWYIGTPKYDEVMLNGYKLGFTGQWGSYDKPSSSLDFKARTILPGYQHITNEVSARQETFREGLAIGVCDMFDLKLNANHPMMRTQVEELKPMREHRGQVSFYIEDSVSGPLLMTGVLIQGRNRQHAKLKVTLFRKKESIDIITTYRIIDTHQKTIGVIISILDEEFTAALAAGELSVAIQLHLHGTKNTYIHNHVEEFDTTTPYRMPGPITGYLNCRDGERIAVCKEFLAIHCEQLQMMFYSTDFSDCGGDEINVDEDSDVVLDALDIIWHRSKSVQLKTLRRVLELGGYWLCRRIQIFIEMAIMHSSLVTPTVKVELAHTYDLQVIKYAIRHPELASTYKWEVSAEDKARIALPAANEIDGGIDGRPF
ncbi:hypothetical protein GCK72_025044 [Caenorhabditis remanei]|uniref:BTB domain-containing protein n=1 Tax=Caenorhabditis remanei TaxID=31234 RepID=A0A6A5G0V2_CAERE|nr:hypothetical protein GCK72_025044 [Caenorhabditis remanei]KAF1748577.1 hypothetical protein GCK72_025044 [Caenorhabditis remanei]